jgi:adenine deaminase
VRVGDTRNDLEDIAKIKDAAIDFRKMALSTDVINLKQLREKGYMDIIVQKTIDLGINPATAVQMATINSADHFGLDSLIGGIAPSKYADILIIPNLNTIQPEIVISNGKVVAENSRALVKPRKHRYSKLARNSIRIKREIRPEEFHIEVGDDKKEVEVRIINQVTELVTQEEKVKLPPREGLLEADVDKDILKVALIDTVHEPGKMFVGFIKGTKMRSGAFAASTCWGLAGIIIIGANENDMAIAVNRVIEMQGGTVVVDKENILAELQLNIAGQISDIPIEIVEQKEEEIDDALKKLGIPFTSANLKLSALTTNAVPYIRICESGYMDIKEGVVLGLFID